MIIIDTIEFSRGKKQLSIFAMTEMALTHAETGDEFKEVNENVDFHIDSTTSDPTDEGQAHDESKGNDADSKVDVKKAGGENARRDNSRRGGPQGRHPPSPVLFLPNMSYDAKERDLADLAQKCPAKVRKSFMYMSSSAHHGFLECNSIEDATKNLEWINNRNLEVKGKRIFAEYSRRRNVDDRRTYEERQHARKGDEVVPPDRRPSSRTTDTAGGYSYRQQPPQETRRSDRRDDRTYSSRDQYDSYRPPAPRGPPPPPARYSRGNDYHNDQPAYPSSGRRRSRSPPRSYKRSPPPYQPSRNDDYYREERRYHEKATQQQPSAVSYPPSDYRRQNDYDQHPSSRQPPSHQRPTGSSGYSYEHDYPRGGQPRSSETYEPPTYPASSRPVQQPSYENYSRYSPNEGGYEQAYPRENAGYERPPPVDSYRQQPHVQHIEQPDIPYHPAGRASPVQSNVPSYQNTDPYGGARQPPQQSVPAPVPHPLLSIRASPVGTRPSYPYM